LLSTNTYQRHDDGVFLPGCNPYDRDGWRLAGVDDSLDLRHVVSNRPQDFFITNHTPRLFIIVMWALVFFAGYLVIRKVQPTNYRAYNLAALAIWFAVMAYLLWTKNRLKRNCAK
jgi:hypothetical protein